jgi:hypothetical protein
MPPATTSPSDRNHLCSDALNAECARLSRIEGSPSGSIRDYIWHSQWRGWRTCPKKLDTVSCMYDDDRRWHGIRRRVASGLPMASTRYLVCHGTNSSWGQVLVPLTVNLPRSFDATADTTVQSRQEGMNPLWRCTRPAAWSAFTTTHPAHETSGRCRESLHLHMSCANCHDLRKKPP